MSTKELKRLNEDPTVLSDALALSPQGLRARNAFGRAVVAGEYDLGLEGLPVLPGN